MKYRKKPVVVEATQWFKNGDHPHDGDIAGVQGHIVRYYRHPAIDGEVDCYYCQKPMHNHGWIDTVQGGHRVCPGDWIITDDRVEDNSHGHYYPCKPDIFEATYELV